MLAKQRAGRTDRSHKTGAENGCQYLTDWADCPRHSEGLRETLPVIRSARTMSVIAFTACGLFRMVPACADSGRVVTGSIGATSDFVFRGLSLTRGKPAAQASLDLEFPKEFYVGAFIATADPRSGPGPNAEMDCWAGKYWRVSENFSGDLRLSQYTYPNDPRHVSYNRTELTGTLGFRDRIFVAAIYSPNTKAVGSSAGYAEGNAWAVEVSARRPLDEHFAVSAGIGHYGLHEIYHDSYNYWNATLIATLKRFEFQLAYLGADDHAAEHFDPDSVGDRVAFTALWRFSTAD
jgi:uncharacterized protein (TIGR02001 family)